MLIKESFPDDCIKSIKGTIVALKNEIKELSLKEGLDREMVQKALAKESEEQIMKKLKYGALAFIEEE